ncbi:hypothetical protein CEXT_390461 [Caerostris extrusa]|uniref:Uncharacterized protein n=1 Tax=Caerostris extrusa TaxID=172846 RepID=A0AAV4Q9R9_CAEEX|nr:hypothetical protein CEXT_390461 [Caerostris extrusa]
MHSCVSSQKTVFPTCTPEILLINGLKKHSVENGIYLCRQNSCTGTLKNYEMKVFKILVFHKEREDSLPYFLENLLEKCKQESSRKLHKHRKYCMPTAHEEVRNN